jgi:tetratricopeptide (TPR) repeat protein
MEEINQISWLQDPNWWLVGLAVLVPLLGAFIKYWKKIKIFFVKIRLKYLPVQFNIAISFKSSSTGINSVYNTEIKRQLLQIIEQFNLSNEIRIRDFQDIVCFKNAEDAQKFCKRKNLDLIIWGSYSSPGLKDTEGRDYSDITLNFTYLHPNDRKGNLGKMIHLELQSVLVLKTYTKIINSSIEDIKIIGENLFDVSTYILGLTLKLFGKIRQSIIVLETVLPKAINKNDIFSKGICFHLINDYQLLVDEACWQNNYKNGYTFSQRILKIDPVDFSGIANAAFFSYKLGNIAEADEKITELEKLYSLNPLTWIDVAFYRITKKDYKGALKIYKKIIAYNLSPKDCNIISVIDFLESQYDANQKELGFLYASSILNYFFADRSRAVRAFSKFLKLSDKRIYRKMRQHVREILNDASEG